MFLNIQYQSQFYWIFHLTWTYAAIILLMYLNNIMLFLYIWTMIASSSYLNHIYLSIFYDIM